MPFNLKKLWHIWQYIVGKWWVPYPVKIFLLHHIETNTIEVHDNLFLAIHYILEKWSGWTAMELKMLYLLKVKRLILCDHVLGVLNGQDY